MSDLDQLTLGSAQHEKEHAGSQIAITLSESSDISRTKVVVAVDATWHHAQRMNGKDTARTSTMYAGQIFHSRKDMQAKLMRILLSMTRDSSLVDVDAPFWPCVQLMERE